MNLFFIVTFLFGAFSLTASSISDREAAHLLGDELLNIIGTNEQEKPWWCNENRKPTRLYGSVIIASGKSGHNSSKVASHKVQRCMYALPYQHPNSQSRVQENKRAQSPLQVQYFPVSPTRKAQSPRPGDGSFLKPVEDQLEE